MDNSLILADWNFVSECPIPKDVDNLLAEGERAVSAYKTVRDTAVFTTKRLIVRDSEGITGRKVQIYSLPYSSIVLWSSENAGMLDMSSEVQLRTLAGNIRVKLGKHVDIRKFDQLIAAAI
jgi:hypothetical protein